LEDIDFTEISEYWTKKDEERKNRSKDEKKKEKDDRANLEKNYAYAIVDGRIEKMSNYNVEPPGIFRGRGEHPLAGKLKPRIWPDSVTINIGEDAPVPKCNVPGLAWKQIVHKNESTWLVSYPDENHHSTKYVFLDATSQFKSKNDKKKYEKARKLKAHIEIIRKDYNSKMKDKEELNNQLGTATYLIDKLALRVGNEKNEDEADTVGCCSLRVEHVQFPNDEEITLDFLGKDSMRYHNTIKVDPLAHANLAKFVKGKKPEDDLFHCINVLFMDNCAILGWKIE
jgi:DNA topoisomerase-1